MEFRVLGPLEVADSEQPFRITGRKERAVLASLIVHLGRARSPEELVAAVWGEDAPPTAEKSLQVRLSHLRSELGDGRSLIVRDGRGYRLAADPERVDAARFERLIDEAARFPPAEALARYDEALALVRGRPYADVEEFDGLATEIRRLDEVRLRGLEGRLRALLDLGRHAEALPELERLTDDEPLHEGYAALHMLALYRSGRQVEALEAYRATARRLHELGLEPADDLRRLERLILEHDERVAAPAAPPPQDAPRTNLPARLTSFVGRESELDALRDRVHNHRLVTVAGPGGVGKTSVAVEAARSQVERFTDGVWLVEIGPLSTAEEIPAAIAGALPFGLPGPDPAGGGTHQGIDALSQELAGREALLVLDNCEHVADAAASVASRLLAAAPRVRIVATSRQPLGVLGEALLELKPFAAEAPHAVRLFADRALAVDPAFSLGGDAGRHVEEICRRLDGLPLAIELAAARARALPVAEIAAQLDDGFTLQPLAQMVEWSFGLLAPAEQELFCLLAVFRAPFTIADAQRIADGPIADQLASLVDRSMVTVEGGGYRLLETLRAFGTERLEQLGARDDAALRHMGWAASLAFVHGDRLWSDGLEQVFRALGPRRADLLAAHDLAVERGEATAALRLATAIGQIEFRLGDAAHGRERLSRTLALDGGETASRLRALGVHSVMLVLHGNLEDGLAHAEEAVRLASAEGGERLLHRSHAVRGLARLLGGDVGGALGDFDGLQERFAVDGDDWILGFVGGWSGFVHRVLGNLTEARQESERALDAFERCQDVWGLLSVTLNLARVLIALGEYDIAAYALDHALGVGEQHVADRLGPLLYEIGLVELRRQNFARATAVWQRCLVLSERPAPAGGWVLLTGPAERWYGLMAGGHLARMGGDRERAGERYAQARALLEEVEREARDTIGVDAAIATSLMFAGEVADDGEAQPLLREALVRAMGSGDRRLVAQVLDRLATQEPDPVVAAAMLGAADGVRAVAGGPLPEPERVGVDALARQLRARLGDRYADAFERGRADPLQVAYDAR